MNTRRRFILLAALAFLGTLAGCNPNLTDELPTKGETVSPQSFGNGVYYFPVLSYSYPPSLAKFIGDSLEVTSATILFDSQKNPTGYVVTVKRNPDPSNLP